MFSYLKESFKKIGVKTTYYTLILYFAFQNDKTPIWAKNIILGTISYLISPIDLIPDLTPFLGYTDDLSVILLGISTVYLYINDDVRKSARNQIKKWFPKVSSDNLKLFDKEMKRN